MRKIILSLMLLAGLAGSAMAGETPTYEVGYSSAANVGVRVSTGAAAYMNANLPSGFGSRIAGYRIQNQDATYAIWCGYTSSVSATAYAATLGVRISAGASASFMIGKFINNPSRIPLYCLADSAAGANGVSASMEWFSY